MTMERYSGRLMQASAVAHLVAGLAWYWSQLPTMIELGGVPFRHRFDREAAIWFLLISPLAWLLGAAWHARIQLERRLPATVGLGLAATGVVICLLTPFT